MQWIWQLSCCKGCVDLGVDWNESMFRKLLASSWSQRPLCSQSQSRLRMMWLEARESKQVPQFFPQPSLSLLCEKGWGNTLETIYSPVIYATYRIQTEFRDKSRVIQWIFHSLSPQNLSFPQYIYCFWVWFWQGILKKQTDLLFNLNYTW